MALRMRTFDWSRNRLGAPHLWPNKLHSALETCLASSLPLQVWWGAELTLFYNDASIPFFALRRHPYLLGHSAREAFNDVWETIGPLVAHVFATGEAGRCDDIPLFLQRTRELEEAFVCFSWTPVFGAEGQVDGVLCSCTETPDYRRREMRNDSDSLVTEVQSSAQNDFVPGEQAWRWFPQKHVSGAFAASASASESLGDPLGARILVVDDEGFQRDHLTRFLSQRWTVEAVNDCDQALTRLRRADFDLVLCSVVTPGMSGFGFLGQMRADPRLKELPMILMSARAEETRLIKGLDAGADDYLLQPFSLSELVARVATHLKLSARRQLARENAALQVLREVSYRLISQDELPTLLQSVVDAAISMTGAAMGALLLYDPSTLSLRIVAQRSMPAEILALFKEVRAEDSAVCGLALRTLKRVLVEDVSQNQAFQHGRHGKVLIAAGVRGLQSTPMLALNGRLVGMIATSWREPRHPDEAILRTLDLLAREAADLIGHRQREEALRRSEARLTKETEALTRLNEASSRLWRMESLEDGLQEMLAATITMLGADRGNVQILNAERRVLRVAAQSGFKPDFLEFFREVSVDDHSACGRALRSGRRILVQDVERDAAYACLAGIARAAGYRAVQSTPLISYNGELLGMLSTHWNAPHLPSETELRCLDLYARQAADFIERKLVEEALLQADRRKDEFLATLAHELRNPLAPISNALFILRESNRLDAVKSGWLLDMMERQTSHLVRLVDDLLEISRITCGKIELRKERIDLGSILNDALESSRQVIESFGHQLIVSPPPMGLMLDADRVRLTQVFANLLNNAAKYTDSGGCITVYAKHALGEAVVSISDTGVGISAEMLPRVFELFAQQDGQVERAKGGLGIGLSLVRSLVELHGGSVEARSEGLGRGSEFVVRLPLAVSGRVGRVSVDAWTAPVLPLRILVMDDHRDAVDSLAQILASWGAEIRIAYNGRDALDILSDFVPEVALLDLGMPGLSGFDVARRIRQSSTPGSLRLVALTGWGQQEDRRRTREAGFDHHLTKPVDIEELRQLLALFMPLPNAGRN